MSKNSNNKISDLWWLIDIEQVGEQKFADHLMSHIKTIMDDQWHRVQRYDQNNILYGSTINTVSAFKRLSVASGYRSLNVIKSTVDALTNKLASKQPQPKLLTNNGSYKQQKKGERLEQFVGGIFYQNGIFSNGRDMFKEAAKNGTGVFRIYEEMSNIKIEHVMAGELFTDSLDDYYGKPTQLFHHKFVHKEVLKRLYPDKAVDIEKASVVIDRSLVKLKALKDNLHNYVSVIECYHLKTATEQPDAEETQEDEDKELEETPTDGKFIRVCQGVVLENLDYDFDYFPYVFFHYDKPAFGFWGTGVTDAIRNIQFSINKTAITIDKSLELNSMPTVLIDINSKVAPQLMGSEVARVIQYKGTKPDFAPPMGYNPQLLEWLNFYYQKAFEIVGISQLSAQSQKPAGLNSGVALENYNDIESERFMCLGQQLEEVYREVAKRVIALARQIYDEKGTFTVKVPGEAFIKSIDWKDCDLQDDEFELQMVSVASLANTTSGRMEKAQELFSEGIIDKDEFRELVRLPDIDKLLNVDTAARQAVQATVERILNKGKYTSPTKYIDLQYALKYSAAQLHLSIDKKVPQKRKDLLCLFIDECQQLLDGMNAQQQQLQQANQAPNPQQPGQSPIQGQQS